jgi:hypothetical protein
MKTFGTMRVFLCKDDPETEAMTTSLERRRAFLLACITALLAIALAMWFIGTVRAEPVAGMSLAGRFNSCGHCTSGLFAT